MSQNSKPIIKIHNEIKHYKRHQFFQSLTTPTRGQLAVNTSTNMSLVTD